MLALIGCGGGDDSGPGGSGGGTSPIDREDGCLAPPPADYDPIESFAWEAPAPDVVVTSKEESGPGSLRAALEEASEGQVIGFAPSLAGATITLSTELHVPEPVTIDATAAPGLVLDGGGQTRIMVIAKNLHTKLVGLTFRNGKTTEEGGAVKVGQADDGAPQAGVEVRGCRFENNSGAGSGGLFIGWRVDAVVEDSVFIGNQAVIGTDEQLGKSGGAIATRQDANIAIRRSVFRENRGATCGAIYNILESITVEDSVFVDNHGDGSGAFFTDGGPAYLRRLYLSGNTGTGDGGAMLIWGYDGNDIVLDRVVVLDSSTTGEKGGVARIHTQAAPLLIRQSAFGRNHSEQQGGALWIDGSGDVTIENTTFAENSVTRDAGGGFTYNGSGYLTVQNCLFSHNSAGRAAAGFWKKPDAPGIVRNTIFAFNEVGENIDERHMGPAPDDGGGNLSFAIGQEDHGRPFANSLFADPLLGTCGDANGTWLCPLGEASPARDAGVSPAPNVDQRGAVRDEAPDIGPFEVSASCPAAGG